MEFSEGDRVRHTVWHTVGTVHLFPDVEPGTASGEVRWDDGFVDSQLDLVADRLVRA